MVGRGIGGPLTPFNGLGVDKGVDTVDVDDADGVE